MTPPSRPRHHRRLTKLKAAAQQLRARGVDPLRGVDLCREAGIEGPHRDACLEAAVRAGILHRVLSHPTATTPAAKHYRLAREAW